MIDETKVLLKLWKPDIGVPQLVEKALESGLLPQVTARRLRNIIAEGFAPRYLIDVGFPAKALKKIQPHLPAREFNQILFLFTCRANLVLADFVREVYWPAYASGKYEVRTEDAERFVVQANQEGKTHHPWSESTIHRVSGYLTGACADFGLLESGRKSVRKILPFRIEQSAAVYLAHDLHFKGHGDNNVLNHPDWALFGMDRFDVLNEMKRLVLKDWLIIQSAGDAIRIAWRYKTMEEIVDAIIER